MLGQHPDLYGFPELHLFSAEMMNDWMRMAASSSYSMEHGLLRSVAELEYGAQTERSIKRARVWLGRRRNWTTGMMFATLMQRIHPRIAVEKGPTLVCYPQHMRRAYRLFPNARFIHLTRDPHTYCASLHRLVREEAVNGDVPRWMLEFLQYPKLTFAKDDWLHAAPLEAQFGWLAFNRNIVDFLRSIPAGQQLMVRGEDVLTDPASHLRTIVQWLGLCADQAAINHMLRPDQSPYAFFGPDNARNGFDPHFLKNPFLMPFKNDQLAPHASCGSLDSEVAALAAQLGYEAAS